MKLFSLGRGLAHKTKQVFQDAWVRGWQEARVPIIVYQMGKVGSTSLSKSLRRKGLHPVYDVHRIDPGHLQEIKSIRAARGFDDVFPPVHQRGLKVYKEIVESNRHAKFISLVRNPVDRNVSAFFYNFVDIEKQYDDRPTESLVDSFLEEYHHDVPLTWFQKEPEVTLNIDVYSGRFPHHAGHVRFSNGPFDLLVLRTELPDEQKSKIVQEYLDVPDLAIQRHNTGKKKSYAHRYKAFKEEVSLPISYLDRMLKSQYAQHFYSGKEIAETYDRWS